MLEVGESLIFDVDHCRRLLEIVARSKGDSSLQTATGRSESAMLYTRCAGKGSKCS
jgi:hypothetical protein